MNLYANNQHTNQKGKGFPQPCVLIVTQNGKAAQGSARVGGKGRVPMEYSDYLRDQATRYRELAAQNEDSFAKKEFLELADICEEVANNMDDQRVSG